MCLNFVIFTRKMLLIRKALVFLIFLFTAVSWAQPQVKEYVCNGEKLMFEKNQTLYRLNNKTIEEITKCNPDTKVVVFFFPLWCAPCYEHFDYLAKNIDLKKHTLLITSVEREESNGARDFFNYFYNPKKEKSKISFPIFILSDEYLSGIAFRASNKGKKFLSEYDKSLKDDRGYGSVAIFNNVNELIYFGNFEDYHQSK